MADGGRPEADGRRQRFQTAFFVPGGNPNVREDSSTDTSSETSSRIMTTLRIPRGPTQPQSEVDFDAILKRRSEERLDQIRRMTGGDSGIDQSLTSLESELDAHLQQIKRFALQPPPSREDRPASDSERLRSTSLSPEVYLHAIVDLLRAPADADMESTDPVGGQPVLNMAYMSYAANEFVQRLVSASLLLTEYRSMDFRILWWRSLYKRAEIADQADQALLDLCLTKRGGGWLKSATRIFGNNSNASGEGTVTTAIDDSAYNVVKEVAPEWKDLAKEAELAKEAYKSADENAEYIRNDTEAWKLELANAIESLVTQFKGQNSVLSIVLNILETHVRDPEYTIDSLSLNMLLMGPPGAGKTTISESMGVVLQKAGILIKPRLESSDDKSLVEFSRATLVEEFLGGTAPKVLRAVTSCFGKIFFLDEAYSLISGDNDQYGVEAINTLVLLMTKYKGRVAFVFAGYQDAMRKLMLSNDGLRRRFEQECVLSTLQNSRLLEILESKLSYKGLDTKQVNDKGTPAALLHVLLSIIRSKHEDKPETAKRPAPSQGSQTTRRRRTSETTSRPPSRGPGDMETAIHDLKEMFEEQYASLPTDCKTELYGLFQTQAAAITRLSNYIGTDYAAQYWRNIYSPDLHIACGRGLIAFATPRLARNQSKLFVQRFVAEAFNLQGIVDPSLEVSDPVQSIKGKDTDLVQVIRNLESLLTRRSQF